MERKHGADIKSTRRGRAGAGVVLGLITHCLCFQFDLAETSFCPIEGAGCARAFLGADM